MFSYPYILYSIVARLVTMCVILFQFAIDIGNLNLATGFIVITKHYTSTSEHINVYLPVIIIIIMKMYIVQKYTHKNKK